MKDFADLLARHAPLADAEALASWDVPYHDAMRWCDQGRLPCATVLLGGNEPVALDFLQGFHLLTFKYQGRCEILVRHHGDKACLQVLLLRKD